LCTGEYRNGYTGRNMYILSDSQAAIKALDSFQIYFKLVWDCHQYLVKLAEHNRIQLVWVPGRIGINGHEITDKLARHGSSHSLIEPEPVLGASTKVARGVIRDWTSGKPEELW
jgi:ribonuclease HI